jgi:uncharacterized protein (DUF983 family)
VIAPATDPPPPLATLLARGARKHCPQCGEGALFKRFNIMHERCAVCGLQYLQDQGDLFGYLFVLDRALFILPLIAMVFLRLYVPSASWFYVLWALLMIALVYTLPHRTGMSIAFDYLLRRRRAGRAL